ncbi:sulfatase-like hydrolase/transferase [Luteolibacter marinus]|uniref:sulfatase-like hydrolase/transferase n=1 Tax=Luteolibacter marinus TaxID=2776705 RepID=UPI001868ACA4|nr:sulfatase-like hydrolase/transferase [Luteolibacter marinus]
MRHHPSLLLAGLLAATGIPSLVAAERPNILYILCDDLGYGDLGVTYQNQRAAQKDRAIPFFTTPRIDTLARDGVMLEQHYCGAPVCAPSRASFLTGLTQGHANVRDNQFDKALADTLTVGSVLGQAGYATAAIGKWGLQGGAEKADGPARPSQWQAYPTKRGFGYYFGYVRHRDGHFHYPKEDGREVWENDREVSKDLDLCFTTDLFTARAKAWITDHARKDPDQPFFLYLAYDTPHAVLHNPPCAYPEGGGLNGGLQWLGKPHAMINSANGTKDGWMHPDYAAATWDHDHKASTPEKPWPEAQKRYANNVRRIDDAVGDLLQLLADLKIDDNTLVVFTSDNGPSQESYLKAPYNPNFFRGFGPFDGIKRDTLEGGMREPTLVRWPRAIPAGKVDPTPSGQWDWLATFADAAGVPVPAATDGVSLLPSLTGKGQRRPGLLYSEYAVGGRTPDYPEFAKPHRKRKRGQMQVVFADGYKGLRYNVKSADDDFEIFDLKKDPKETRNLAKKPGFAALQATLKARALQSRMPDSSAPRPYDEALVPGLAQEPKSAAGLTCAWHAGEFPWLPDFRTLEPEKRSTVPELSLPAGLPVTPFGLSFEGYFHAKEDGPYTFRTRSDGETMLFVHDCRVIHGRENGSIRLKAGWHPVRFLYRHSSGSPALSITVQPPHGEPVALGGALVRTLPSS